MISLFHCQFPIKTTEWYFFFAFTSNWRWDKKNENDAILFYIFIKDLMICTFPFQYVSLNIFLISIFLSLFLCDILCRISSFSPSLPHSNLLLSYTNTHTDGGNGSNEMWRCEERIFVIICTVSKVDMPREMWGDKVEWRRDFHCDDFDIIVLRVDDIQ